jgi:hypothetical protein
VFLECIQFDGTPGLDFRGFPSLHWGSLTPRLNYRLDKYRGACVGQG